MKRSCALMLPAMLLIILAAPACNDESLPKITRVRVAPACGVAPLEIETYAAVTGGNEAPPGLGGTNNLEITWDFDDGGSGSTSISYHRYTEPGTYDIVVTATDPDGNTASGTVPVTVLADSLVMSALAEPAAGDIPVGQTVQFGISATTCKIDFPAEPGDAVKMTYLWRMDDADETTFSGPTPQFTFLTPGEFDVQVAVTYPELAVTRHDTLHYTVTP